MKHLDTIFKRFPYLEVIIRMFYWRIEFFHKLVVLGRSYFNECTKRKSKSLKQLRARDNSVEISDIILILKAHRVRPGDILILHSEINQLLKFNSNPNEIIREILAFLGPKGTLATPCFPKYKDAAIGFQRVVEDIGDTMFTYDVRKTPPWTGLLALAAMRYPGAIRSSFPLNSLVAIGHHAADMFKEELTTPLATPNGVNSAWAFCAKRNAVIVCFGIDLVHSLTMIHTAEDMQEDTWPVPNWYRRRLFRIVNGNNEKIVKIKERHPKWAMHFAERKLAYDLENAELSHRTNLSGVEVTSIRSESLLGFLRTHPKPGYPYYLWSI